MGVYDSEDVTVTVLPLLESRSADETVQFVSESEWFMQSLNRNPQLTTTVTTLLTEKK